LAGAIPTLSQGLRGEAPATGGLEPTTWLSRGTTDYFDGAPTRHAAAPSDLHMVEPSGDVWGIGAATVPLGLPPGGSRARPASWWQPVDAGARGEEEDAPILAPGQVRGQLRQNDAPSSVPSARHTQTPPGRLQNTLPRTSTLRAVGHAGSSEAMSSRTRAIVSMPSGRSRECPMCLWAESSMYSTDSSGEEARPVRKAKSSDQHVGAPVGSDAYTPWQGCSFPGMGWSTSPEAAPRPAGWAGRRRAGR